jgi:uncharacterized protein (TIGR02265 family)
MEGPSLTPPPHPVGSPEELRWRLSLIDASIAVRGVVFNSVLETVRQLGDERAVEQCLQAAGERRFMDFFNYPYGSLIQMTYNAAWLLGSRYGSFEQALWHMGHQAAASFYASTAGRAVLLLSRGGPARLLESIVPAFQLTRKDAEVSARLTGPRGALLIYNRDFVPRPYTHAGLEATFAAAQVPGVTIRSRPTGPFDTVYELSWE